MDPLTSDVTEPGAGVEESVCGDASFSSCSIPSLMDSTMKIVCQQLQENIRSIDGILNSISEILASTSQELSYGVAAPKLIVGRQSKRVFNNRRSQPAEKKRCPSNADITDIFGGPFAPEAVAFCEEILNEDESVVERLEKDGMEVVQALESCGDFVASSSCKLIPENVGSPAETVRSNESDASSDSCSLPSGSGSSSVRSFPCSRLKSSIIKNVPAPLGSHWGPPMFQAGKKLEGEGLNLEKGKIAVKRRRKTPLSSGQSTPTNLELVGSSPNPFDLDEDFFNSPVQLTEEENTEFNLLFPEL